MAYSYNENNQGEFKEKEYGKYFTYRKLTPSSPFWEYAQDSGLYVKGFINEIDVLDGYRLAKVLKTVAYVVTDEDAEGAVIEKWEITRKSYLD